MLFGPNPEKFQASLFIIIYTILASMPFLAGIIRKGNTSNSIMMEIEKLNKIYTNV